MPCGGPFSCIEVEQLPHKLCLYAPIPNLVRLLFGKVSLVTSFFLEEELGDETQEGGEGCLSVPGLGFDTPRRQWARVSGLDEHGQEHEAEATGLLARCFQHEHDHLLGTLYVNRLEGQARREAWRRIRAGDYDRTVAEVRHERAGTLGSSFGG